MNKLTSFILISLSALLLFTGCSTDVEDTAGTDYLLAGYYMIAGDETPIADDTSGTSRATAPVHQAAWDDMTFTEWMVDTVKINNYPERGQKTYVTVTGTGTENIYFVKSETYYPKKEDLFEKYIEEYYVKNIDHVDDSEIKTWNNHDPVTDAAGNPDSKARTTMEVHFQDGSIRKEWIEYDTSDSVYTDAADVGNYYAHFDIDGDLTIPTDTTWTPATPTTEGIYQWSSKVYYYQKIETYINWFYNENKEIFGVRYYTLSDHDGDEKYDTSTLTYENTLTRKVSAFDSDWASILEWVFGGSSSGTSGSSTGDTLAETVIREQISENGKKTVNSSTKVVPTFGDSFTIDKSIEYDLID